MKIFKRFRALSWAKVRAGARELDGARGFLRAMRSDFYMWVLAVAMPWFYGFDLVWFMYVIALFGATCRAWSLEGYRKMLDGYGTMVDQQQEIIGTYQGEHLHPSEKLARARARRMN